MLITSRDGCVFDWRDSPANLLSVQVMPDPAVECEDWCIDGYDRTGVLVEHEAGCEHCTHVTSQPD